MTKDNCECQFSTSKKLPLPPLSTKSPNLCLPLQSSDSLSLSDHRLSLSKPSMIHPSTTMAYNPKPHLGLLLLFTLCTLSLSGAAFAILLSDDAPTVYELLPKFGLPSGLLPDSVKCYSLSDDDGSFVVELEDTCYVQFEYLVYYEKKITGKLEYGSIRDLKGIQVQELFLWFDVDGIMVDLPPSDNIYFEVGFINKRLDVGQFKTVHSCREKVSARSGQSWKRIKELPAPVDHGIQMLITTE